MTEASKIGVDLFAKKIQAALHAKARALLNISTISILLANEAMDPKKKNRAAVAIALAVARNIDHGHRPRKCPVFDPPSLSNSKCENLEMWVADQVSGLPGGNATYYMDGPLQATITTLMSQLQHDIRDYVQNVISAYEAGESIYSPEERQKELVARGIVAGFSGELCNEVEALRALADISRNRSFKAKNTWSRRAWKRFRKEGWRAM